MTDISPAEVNTHTVAVAPEKLEQPTIEKLLKNEERENK